MSRRADLDRRTYELRRQGLTFQAIAERLEMSPSGVWRRIARYERQLREQAEPAQRPRRSRE
jgi:DNA-binding Lrp family transcriptional regulator